MSHYTDGQIELLSRAATLLSQLAPDRRFLRDSGVRDTARFRDAVKDAAVFLRSVIDIMIDAEDAESPGIGDPDL